MTLISDGYRALNVKSHCENELWGSGDLVWHNKIASLLIEHGVCSVIDYGCGKGGMVKALSVHGYDVQGYDPAVACYADLPRPADFLVCLDVLEHVEPDCLGPVLAHVRDLAPRCFLVIATRPAKHVLSDGRNAHLIVQDDAWWLERLGYHFSSIAILPPKGKREFVVFCEA